MSFKELYMAEVERITADLEAAGMNPDAAYDIASNSAFDTARERFADLADWARDEWKERGL